MLVLTRTPDADGNKINLWQYGKLIASFEVLQVRGERVKIGVDAAKDIVILRHEIGPPTQREPV